MPTRQRWLPDLSKPIQLVELSFRPSLWVERCLKEIAADLKIEFDYKQLGLGKLIEKAINDYMALFAEGKIEQMPYPTPDEEIAEIGKEQYELIGVGKFSQPIQVYVPPYTLAELDRIAKTQDRDRSKVMRDAVYVYIKWRRQGVKKDS